MSHWQCNILIKVFHAMIFVLSKKCQYTEKHNITLTSYHVRQMHIGYHIPGKKKPDVATHDGHVPIHFLNLQVMSLVTWGNGNGSSDSSTAVSFSLSLRAVNFLSAQSNKAILSQVQLWSNLNGLS